MLVITAGPGKAREIACGGRPSRGQNGERMLRQPRRIVEVEVLDQKELNKLIIDKNQSVGVDELRRTWPSNRITTEFDLTFRSAKALRQAVRFESSSNSRLREIRVGATRQPTRIENQSDFFLKGNPGRTGVPSF